MLVAEPSGDKKALPEDVIEPPDVCHPIAVAGPEGISRRGFRCCEH